MKPVRVPRACGEYVLVEKRSKFIGVLFPVEGEQDTLARLNEVRTKHREATHNVYAYRLLENQIMRYNDDGEPQGTAGMPVLEVLRREDINNVLCVVTRYFGGTLLGAGGLVRAYAAAAKGALDAAGIAVLQPLAFGQAKVPYPWWEQVERLLGTFDARLEDVQYADAVSVAFVVTEEQQTTLVSALTELTNGQVSVTWTGVALGAL